MLASVLVFLLLLIALLAIPVRVTFLVSREETLERTIELKWMYGLVRVRIPPAAPATTGAEEVKHKPSRQQRSARGGQSAFDLLRQDALRRRLIKFGGNLWDAVRKDDVRLHIRIGLDDPADTGQLWAVIGPVSAMLKNIRSASIEIEPIFTDPSFELHSSGSLRVVPLQVLCLTIGLLLSPPVWQLMRVR